jgi:hypothetical protein
LVLCTGAGGPLRKISRLGVKITGFPRVESCCIFLLQLMKRQVYFYHALY